MPTGAKKKAKRAKAVKPPPDLDQLFELATAALKRDSAVRITALGPPPVRPVVVERLRAAGYEVTKTQVRRNVSEQLRDVLSEGAFIPLKDARAFVSGATAAEAKAAAIDLTKSGAANLVLRTKVETIVLASTQVLDRADVKTLKTMLEPLVKQLASAVKSRKNLTLLTEDIASVLKEAARVTSTQTTRERAMPGAADMRHLSGAETRQRVLNAVDAARNEQLGLSFVPHVLKQLTPEMDLTAAQAALLLVARLGLVELRPEGGLGRLSDAELLLCPPGPEGTRLSWARRVEGMNV